MRIDFDAVFKTPDNEEMLVAVDGKVTERKVTLGMICTDQLLQAPADPQNPSAPFPMGEKHRRWHLVQQISAGGKVDLSVEDLALLKKLTDMHPKILIAGQCWDLLDPKNA